MRFSVLYAEVYGGRSMAKPKNEGRGNSTVRQDSRLAMGPISLREASIPPAANTPEIPDTSNSADTLTFAKINYTSIAQVRLLIINVCSSLSQKWVTLTSLFIQKEKHFGLVSLILL